MTTERVRLQGKGLQYAKDLITWSNNLTPPKHIDINLEGPLHYSEAWHAIDASGLSCADLHAYLWMVCGCSFQVPNKLCGLDKCDCPKALLIYMKQLIMELWGLQVRNYAWSVGQMPCLCHMCKATR